MEEYIYVLRLTDGKWYIGKTKDVFSRISCHKNGKGCEWTKNHPYKLLEECHPKKTTFHETEITLKYMKKYGIENVRGGPYCKVHLNHDTIENLKKQIYHDENKCFQCGKEGHFAKNCTVAKKEVSSFLPPINTVRHHNRSQVTCYRCGRNGHIAPECFAKTNVNGYPLTNKWSYVCDSSDDY